MPRSDNNGKNKQIIYVAKNLCYQKPSGRKPRPSGKARCMEMCLAAIQARLRGSENIQERSGEIPANFRKFWPNLLETSKNSPKPA